MALLFVAALGLTFALTGANVTADSLFQSPQSPVEAAPPPVNPTPIPPPQPAEPVAPAQDQTAPVEPAPATGSEPQPAPVDAGQPAPADSGQPVLEGETPLPPPLPEPERPSRRDPTPPGGDDAQMVVDQAEFIDTVVVSFAYVWLCCGIVLILVIPLIFLFLHIRGRSKMLKEEQY